MPSPNAFFLCLVNVENKHYKHNLKYCCYYVVVKWYGVYAWFTTQPAYKIVRIQLVCSCRQHVCMNVTPKKAMNKPLILFTDHIAQWLLVAAAAEVAPAPSSVIRTSILCQTVGVHRDDYSVKEMGTTLIERLSVHLTSPHFTNLFNICYDKCSPVVKRMWKLNYFQIYISVWKPWIMRRPKADVQVTVVSEVPFFCSNYCSVWGVRPWGRHPRHGPPAGRRREEAPAAVVERLCQSINASCQDRPRQLRLSGERDWGRGQSSSEYCFHEIVGTCRAKAHYWTHWTHCRPF